MNKSFTMIMILIFGLGLWAGQMDQDKKLVFNHYVSAQEALASDDFDSAKKALQLLKGVSQAKLKELTESALKAEDLKSLRQAFQPLSGWMAKAKLPDGLAVAYCPMVKSHWVQKFGEVANPFYGSSMLRCGNFVDMAKEKKPDNKH